MFNKVSTYLKEGNTYSSLGIYECDGTNYYSLLQVKRSKGELHVVFSKTSSELENLTEHVKKNSPLLLALNTSSVLTKQIDTSDSSTPEAIVNHVFPNLSFDSFHYEIIQEQGRPIVSITKKKYVNGILEKLKELGLFISKISIGPLSIVPILRHLEHDEITIPNTKLKLQNQSVIKINPDKEVGHQEYLINGIELNSDNLLLFGQILGHLKQSSTITNFGEHNSNLISTFGNQRIFNKVSKIALFFFLGILLINFFVFDFYHGASQEQNLELNISASQRANLQILQEAVDIKQNRLETLSASSNSRSTYYLDLFAKDVPATISLYRITYRPLKKPIRDTKPVELEDGLFVSGISENSIEFSKWIEALESRPWIASVETLDYDFLNGKSSNFSLKIDIREN